MPLDVMLSRNEWQIKWNEGRIAWMPSASAVDASEVKQLALVIIALGLSAGRMIPIGLLIEKCKWGSLPRAFLAYRTSDCCRIIASSHL